MDYKTVAEARQMSGLRLALSAGTCGPWGEAAKAAGKVVKLAKPPKKKEATKSLEDALAASLKDVGGRHGA